MAEEIKVGDQVEVKEKNVKGEISFIGTTAFASGKWIGVVLPEAKGKNDGSVQGKSYFKCKANHGIFVRQNQVTLIKPKSGLTTPKPKSGLTKPSVLTPKIEGYRGYSGNTPEEESDAGHRQPRPLGLPNRVSGIPSGLRPPGGGSRLSMMSAGRSSKGSSPSRGSSSPSRGSSTDRSGKQSTDDIPTKVTRSEASQGLSKSSSNASSTSIGGNSTKSSKDPTPTKSSGNKKPMSAKTPQKETSKPGSVPKTITPKTTNKRSPSPKSSVGMKSRKSSSQPQNQTGRHPTIQENDKTSVDEITSAGDPSELDNHADKVNQENIEVVAQSRTPSNGRSHKTLSTGKCDKNTADKQHLSSPTSGKSGSSTATPAKSSSTATTPAKSGSAATTPAKSGSAATTPAKSSSTATTPAKSCSVVTLPSKSGSVAATPTKSSSSTKNIAGKGVDKPAPGNVGDTKIIEGMKKENTELKASVIDLEEKVAFLTAKRVDDKAKIKEMEKYKIQITQFTDYKSQWTASQSELHEQVKVAKKEAKESTEARTKAESELEELRDRVEDMALDKEMAEERAEVAELELEEMKEQRDEVKQELDLLKAELEAPSTDGTGGTSVDNVKFKQMEIQNNKLKEAVIKLKEINTQDKKQVETLTIELTKSQSQATEFSKLKDNLESELEEHENMMLELTEQVDASLGAEAMVEKLTDQNLELDEKLNRMTEEMMDLEALRDLNEELEEQHLATERELREELEISRNTHYQLTRRVEECTEKNNDLQQVIMQFRSYVNQLQAQLKETQAQMSEEKQASVGVDEAKMAQLAQMQAQLLETKSNAAPTSYDADFASIPIQQGVEEVRLLKYFFPERFMAPGGDYEAIKLLLLLDELIWTSDVITKVTSSHLKLSDVLSGSALSGLQLEKSVFAADLVIELGHFKVAVKAFQHCIKQCDPDTFLRLGRISGDLGPHISMLSNFKIQLEKQTLDESVSVEPVIQSAESFQTLRTNYFADIQPSCREILADNLMVMTRAAEGVIVCCEKTNSSLSRVQEGSKMSEKVNEIKTSCTEYLRTIRRIKNFVPADGKPFSFPSEINTMLTNATSELCKIFSASRTVAKNLSMHMAGFAEDDVVTVPDIEDIVKKGCATVGTTGAEFDRVLDHINTILPSLQQMSKNLQDGDYDQLGDADTQSEPPYIVRSHHFKEQFALGDQLKAQLEFKNSENFELKKMVKIKGEEMSQQAVKTEMLEKRLENARRDGDGKLDAMKKQITDLNKSLADKDKQFEETMDQLQEDIDSLEGEKATLKSKLEQANKRAPRAHLTESILAEQASGQPGSVRVIVEDSPATLSKLESLQSYAQVVQEENVKLMANKIKSQMAALSPLQLVTRNAPEIAVEKDVNELQQQLLSMIANTKVIDVTKSVNGKTPGDILAEQKATQTCLHNKFLKLKLQAQKEMGRYYSAAGFIQTGAGDFVTPEFSRVLKEKENVNLYGKIRIPSSRDNGLYKILLDSKDLRSINSTLLGAAG